MKIFLIRFLNTVIWKRPAWNLPACNATVIGKRTEINRIDSAALLQYIERLLGAFIYERVWADLNTNCFFHWLKYLPEL